MSHSKKKGVAGGCGPEHTVNGPAKAGPGRRLVNTANHVSGFVRHYNRHYGCARAASAISYSARVAMHRFSSPGTTVNVNGYTLSMVPGDRGISSELLAFGVHEPLLTKSFPRMVRKGMTCIDVGGNIGYYALMESRLVGKEGRVIAIEPSPVNYEHLNESVRLSEAHVDTYNMAAGDADRTANFLVARFSNHSRIVPEGQEPDIPGRLVAVPMRRLDGFLKELGVSADFVRMDVEGYERQVIAGLPDTIEEHRPAFQIEVHRRRMGADATRSFLEMFRDAEYECTLYIPRDIDLPMICRDADVGKHTLAELLAMIDDDTFRCCNILLESVK